MIIQKLDDKNILIKHETMLNLDFRFDPKDAKNKKERELFLFDDFFKGLVADEEIAVQVFEIMPKTTQIGSYFGENKIWDNRENWNKWESEFKKNHTIYLYFYDPLDRKRNLINGIIDGSPSKEAKYSEHHQEEYFKIKDYSINESEFASSFEIEIPVDSIKECLEKSQILECRNFLKRFQYEYLSDLLPEEHKKTSPKNKI